MYEYVRIMLKTFFLYCTHSSVSGLLAPTPRGRVSKECASQKVRGEETADITACAASVSEISGSWQRRIMYRKCFSPFGSIKAPNFWLSLQILSKQRAKNSSFVQKPLRKCLLYRQGTSDHRLDSYLPK